VREGHTDIVKRLIKKGADINVRDSLYGYTPLMWAISEGHEKIAALLIENAAYVSVENYDGKTALDLARESNMQEIMALLKKLRARE
jgi:ankyrin repeat protein